MNSVVPDSAAIDRIAWCLAHFLWQGSLIALLAAGALRLLHRSSPQMRYAVAVGAMLAMVAAPAATFFVFDSPPASPLTLIRFTAPIAASVPGALPAPSETVNWTSWVVVIWLAGVVACLVRLGAAWRFTRRLADSAAPIRNSEILTAFARLRHRIVPSRRVRLLLSTRVASPIVLGWLRPAIVFPAAALAGLDADQFEAILAHELAHIRRHDLVVNLLQRCVESLLFYHPAVWWLSARIRSEREHCCDDVAIGVCGDRLLYARTLVELEERRAGEPALAVAASTGDLTQRIRRILGRDAAEHDWIEPAAVSMLIVALLVVAACQTKSVSAQTPAAPSAPSPQTSRSFQTSSGERDSWVMYSGGITIMHGSSTDELETRALRRSFSGDFLWFRTGGKAYVIEDRATLDRITALFAPMDELGKQQQVIGEQQRLLGEQQSKLGEEMSKVRVSVPNLEEQLAKIRAEIRSSATQEDLGRLQNAIGELQSQIGELQSRAGSEQSVIGQRQSELGEKQSELGRQQSRLGDQQSALAAKANAEVTVILREAVRNGSAHPAP